MNLGFFARLNLPGTAREGPAWSCVQHDVDVERGATLIAQVEAAGCDLIHCDGAQFQCLWPDLQVIRRQLPCGGRWLAGGAQNDKKGTSTLRYYRPHQ